MSGHSISRKLSLCLAWAVVVNLLGGVFLCDVSAEEPGVAVRVLNKGVGGHNTRNGLARFDKDVVKQKPNHLILYFGMNDACNSRNLVPLEQFRKNLQAMIDRAPTRNIVLVTPNPVIVAYLAERHPTHPNKDDLQENLDRYGRAVRELAKKNRLLLADLSKLVDQQGGATLEKGSLLRNVANSKSRDGVHLTARGYQLMAKQIAALLKGRVQPGETVVCMGDSLTYGASVKGAGTASGETYPGQLAKLLNDVKETSK